MESRVEVEWVEEVLVEEEMEEVAVVEEETE